MKDILLDGQWEFRGIDAYGTLPADKRGVTRWMAATVPGTVHTDLMNRKMIDDPFYRMNENDVQWVDTLKWAYKKKFAVPENIFMEDSIDLEASGLDTFAEIICNGTSVADTSNMFVEHRIPLKQYLRPGMNELLIVFDSPTHRSKALEETHGRLEVGNDPHRVYARKAQYSFGWDWGPHLTTSGIWRSIRLQAYSDGRLAHPFAKVLSVSDQEAVVELSVDVHRTSGVPLTVQAFVGGGTVAREYTGEIRDGRAVFDIRIPEPRLWWPNECGPQPLYTAVISLRRHTEEVHEIETSFAVRTLKLIQESDEQGRSFIIEVNGRKIFCKGADWIPSDSFIPRIPDSTYHRLLTLARQAHMNMIRVWGGGIYEQDVFYDLCDRLGLMVWQDFMFACGEYPAGEWFTSQVRDEAVKVVKRLRNHPSIVVWCGNNEAEWIYCTAHPLASPDDMKGSQIFRDILPSVCAQDDGTRIYWRSSPFGDGFPNDESNGTHHQWKVWSFWKDFREYANDNARFVSEFGFQAPANRETFERVTDKGDRTANSEVMEHHNKQVEGTERLFKFLAAHYRITGSFDDFIYYGQMLQAEALKFGVEHWRRRKYKTAGTLFWQLNDCWPVTSWAVIDSELTPKAGYYFTKRFFAPILLTLKPEAESIDVWLTNDAGISLTGTVVIELVAMNGSVRWKRSKRIVCDADDSYVAARVLRSAVEKYDLSAHYLRASFETRKGTVTENRCFFKEPKHLQLPKAKVKWKLSAGTKPGTLALTVSCSKLAKGVRLEVEGGGADFSDNYFDIDGGTKKHVMVTTEKPRSWLKSRLSVRSMQ